MRRNSALCRCAWKAPRFDLSHEKWYKWIRDNKPRIEVDYLRLEDFRDSYTHKLNEARIKFGEPPAQHHKEIIKELQGMLTATGNIYRRESANMEFQEALNKACLADHEYHRSPSVKISSAIIRDWQEQKYKNDRRLHKRDREEVGLGVTMMSAGPQNHPRLVL